MSKPLDDVMHSILAKAKDALTEEFVQKLKAHAGYFIENAGKWVDLDDMVFPLLRLDIGPCEMCGGKLKLRLYIPEVLGLPGGVTKDTVPKIQFNCLQCTRTWIDEGDRIRA